MASASASAIFLSASQVVLRIYCRWLFLRWKVNLNCAMCMIMMNVIWYVCYVTWRNLKLRFFWIISTWGVCHFGIVMHVFLSFLKHCSYFQHIQLLISSILQYRCCIVRCCVVSPAPLGQAWPFCTHCTSPEAEFFLVPSLISTFSTKTSALLQVVRVEV